MVETSAGSSPLTSSSTDGERDRVERAIGKDPEAVRSLIRAIGPVIHGRVAKALVRRRGGAGRDVSHEIEDMTQEVFLSLFENDGKLLRAWDPARGPLGAFVALLADHHVYSTFRSGKRRPWSDDLDVIAEPEATESTARSPEVRVASKQALQALLDRLRAELSPKGFDVFLRLYVEEQPIEKVSQELGMTADSLYAWRTRLSKLVRTLAVELEATDGDSVGEKRDLEARPMSGSTDSPRTSNSDDPKRRSKVSSEAS